MSEAPLDQPSVTDPPSWDLLPTPSPVPLVNVEPYDSPRLDSRDPVVLRLSSAWEVWTLTIVASLSILFFTGLAMTASPGFLLLALPAACATGYSWYRLLLPRRLCLDSEGLELFGVGTDPDVHALRWDEIQSLHLEQRLLSPGGSAFLHLIAEPTPNSPLFSEIDNTIDLTLGITEPEKVDAALRVYASKIYHSRS